MENAEMLVSMVGSLGFPIVSCVFLWRYINGTMKDFTDVMRENTLLLSRLYDMLGRMDSDDRR